MRHVSGRAPIIDGLTRANARGPLVGLTRGLRLFAAAGASQAAGLVLIIMVLRFSSASVSDQYFFFLAWASVPVFIVTYGIMYPLWLRGHACDARSIAIAAVCMSSLIILGQLVSSHIVVVERGAQSVTFSLAVVTGTFGVASGASNLAGWFLASRGSGIWPGVVGLCPNVGGCLAIAVFASSGDLQAVCLGAGVGQTVGALVGLVLALPAVRSRHQIAAQERVRANAGSVVALSLRALSGYGVGLSSQTAVLTLSAGSVSLFAVLSRLTGGLIAVIVNAAVPPLVNRNGVSPRLWLYLSATMAATLGGAIALGLWGPNLPWDGYGSWLGVCALWLAAATLNATTQAAMLREPGNAGVMRVVIVACLGILAVVASVMFDVVSLPLIFSISVAVEMAGAIGAAWRTAQFAPTLGWSSAICITGAMLAFMR